MNAAFSFSHHQGRRSRHRKPRLESLKNLGIFRHVTAAEVIETVATMPREDCLKIQEGIAEIFVSRFSPTEVADIRDALAEADAEFARGEGHTGAEVRSKLGLA